MNSNIPLPTLVPRLWNHNPWFLTSGYATEATADPSHIIRNLLYASEDTILKKAVITRDPATTMSLLGGNPVIAIPDHAVPCLPDCQSLKRSENQGSSPTTIKIPYEDFLDFRMMETPYPH